MKSFVVIRSLALAALLAVSGALLAIPIGTGASANEGEPPSVDGESPSVAGATQPADGAPHMARDGLSLLLSEVRELIANELDIFDLSALSQVNSSMRKQFGGVQRVSTQAEVNAALQQTQPSTTRFALITPRLAPTSPLFPPTSPTPPNNSEQPNTTENAEDFVTTHAPAYIEISHIPAPLRVICLKGVHVCVSDVDIVALDGANVSAGGSSRVWAFGAAEIEASDSASVYAFDDTQVCACDTPTIIAQDSARVRAFESTTVISLGDARVAATGTSTVYAYDASRIYVPSSSVTVQAHGTHVRVILGLTSHPTITTSAPDETVSVEEVRQELRFRQPMLCWGDFNSLFPPLLPQ